MKTDDFFELDDARLRLLDAIDRARDDAAKRLGELSPANADAWLKYLDERINHWRKELNA